MSVFMSAMQTSDSRTTNGAVTHSTSGSECLNFFFTAGALRRNQGDAKQLFNRAFAENPGLAVRILLWARDIRGGAGERQTFRTIFQTMCHKNPEYAERIMMRIPELGRFDDLVVAFNTPMEEKAIALWVDAIVNQRNGLAAKWFPRERSKNGFVFKRVVSALDITPRKWRKVLSTMSDTVEQKMCAGLWDEIEFGKLPSVASARYQSAFGRNAFGRYSEYISGLQKGTEKINASAVYPYDVVKSTREGNALVANEQWKALPNYMEGNTELVIPVVDVSGSMDTGINGSGYSRGSVTCKDVAMSLGVYIAERNEGIFKNQFISFSSDPHFHSLVGTNLTERLANMNRSGEDMSTNIQRCFEVILQRAVHNGLKQEDLPAKLLILSDMEFDQASRGGWRSNETNFEAIRRGYAQAGYEMPQLVFWNIAGRQGNVPVKMNDKGVALVSGCSPSILTSLLSGELDPMKIMLKTVLNERYTY